MATKTKKNTNKKKKPGIGNRKPKEVKEKKKRSSKKVTPLPEFPIPMIDGEVNPLLSSKRMKRALCVALARETDDDDVLCKAVRQAGVCQKAGITYENLKTEALPTNELSGRGYALRFARKKQEAYYQKKPEAVDACAKFAKKLVNAVTKGELDKVRKEALDEFEKAKGDLIEAQKEAAKKAKKSSKKSSKKGDKKPTLKGKKAKKKSAKDKE